MNSKLHPSGPSGGGDSWESLAEDLFGIDFAKTSESGQIISADELSVEDLEEPSENGDEPASEAETASIDNETDQPTVELAGKSNADEPWETVATGPEDVDSDEVETDEQQAAVIESISSSTDKETDTYWDALNSWQQDSPDEVSSESTPEKPPRTRRPRESSQSSARPSQPQPPAPKREDVSTDVAGRDEFNDDVDFGFGLLEQDELSPEEASASLPETDSSVESSSTESNQGDTETKKRRRRRRRRPQKDDRKVTGDKTDADESATEQETEISADEITGEATPRRASRRRPRPTKNLKAIETSEATTEVTPEGQEEAAKTESDDELWEAESDESGESKSSTRSVPTWEEAISFLLNPSRSDSHDDETTQRAKSKKEPAKSSARRPQRRR